MLTDRALLALVIKRPTGECQSFMLSSPRKFDAEVHLSDYTTFVAALTECNEDNIGPKWAAYGSLFRTVIRGRAFRSALPPTSAPTA